MTLDGKLAKSKVVDLDENYNFIVDDFLFQIIWMSQKYGSSFDDLKFKFVKRSQIAKRPN